MIDAVNYQADYRSAQAAGHHPDCDGYRTAHRSHVESAGRGMWKAVCDECGPLHPGSFGDAAKSACETIARSHGYETPCDGRCRDWDAQATSREGHDHE